MIQYKETSITIGSKIFYGQHIISVNNLSKKTVNMWYPLNVRKIIMIKILSFLNDFYFYHLGIQDVLALTKLIDIGCTI